MFKLIVFFMLQIDPGSPNLTQVEVTTGFTSLQQCEYYGSYLITNQIYKRPFFVKGTGGWKCEAAK